MKKIMSRNAVGGAAIVMASMSAGLESSQSIAAASAPSMASAASAPVATRKENRALRKLVYAAFAKDKSIDAGDIGVSAKDGAVTLTGTAADAAQIEKAATLARGVPGVTSVTNKLTVRRNFAQ
ncbi:BON domain-containing protein [Caballeronia sp. LZ008]|uniref:BON domain-containing protein n=1 Tax=unclassified Caballeronia TaxID=2646786 RepID=UPI002027B98C|nr:MULTISPECIES: BON domain-containing protein [unclassified Caballeronia]MDR5795722.1 BON domain-containing protein [Caballeronia sp. LZ008]